MKFKLTLLSLFMAAALPALAQTPVYLDTNKSVEERVKDALTRMTLEEKVAMISRDLERFISRNWCAEVFCRISQIFIH